MSDTSFKQKSSPSIKWSHKDNAAFYEVYPPEQQLDHAKKGGLADWSDLKQIAQYLEKADSILELGACNGRVLDFLLMNHYGLEITAIERSKQFFSILEKKYQEKIALFNTDIIDFSAEKKFDLILWMWSGISDFEKSEQLNVLKKYVDFLNPNGKIVLETFLPEVTPLNAEDYAEQTYIAKIGDHTLRGYVPSLEELMSYAEKLGLLFQQKIYKTTTGRKRAINILSKFH